jgi:hypothetical protein
MSCIDIVTLLNVVRNVSISGKNLVTNMDVRKESSDSRERERVYQVKTEVLTHPERGIHSTPPRPANFIRSRLVSSLLSVTMT